jgi:hypothetical protein
LNGYDKPYGQAEEAFCLIYKAEVGQTFWEEKLAITVGLRNVGFLGWKVSPPILLLSKEKCVAPKPTLLKPTAVIANLKKRRIK